MENDYQAERQSVENEFVVILRTIRELHAEYTQQNLTPTEVWLGPTEARTLQREIEFQLDEGRARHTEPNLNSAIYGTIDGLKLFGLDVRTQQNDGIRLGHSITRDFPKALRAKFQTE